MYVRKRVLKKSMIHKIYGEYFKYSKLLEAPRSSKGKTASKTVKYVKIMYALLTCDLHIHIYNIR